MQSGAPQQDAPAEVKPAPITDGATAFKVRGCGQCHEIRGVGGRKGPDLSGVGRRLKKDTIERQIVSGGDAMPAFGEALQPEEIAGLVKYLNKCRDKLPRGKKAMPAMVAPVVSPE
jgi:mono/diheme cytochrome c family protein